jgi:hypothetical protein
VHDVEELRATRKRQVVSSKVSSKKYLNKAPAASSDKIKREKLKKKVKKVRYKKRKEATHLCATWEREVDRAPWPRLVQDVAAHRKKHSNRGPDGKQIVHLEVEKRPHPRSLCSCRARVMQSRSPSKRLPLQPRSAFSSSSSSSSSRRRGGGGGRRRGRGGLGVRCTRSSLAVCARCCAAAARCWRRGGGSGRGGGRGAGCGFSESGCGGLCL